MGAEGVRQSSVIQLESEIRTCIARLLVAMTICCFFIEIGMGIFFWVSKTLYQTIGEYIAIRVLLPASLNVLLCLMVFAFNHTGRYGDVAKNRAASLALVIFAGNISIAHSYFVPIWGLPLCALLYVSVFHDPFIHKIEMAMCMLFIAVTCWTHISDYPDDISFSLQCLIVTELVGILIGYMSFQLESFCRKEFILNIQSDAGKIRYKAEYETDKLTGVYSRAHLIEQAEYIFNNCNELSPAGIAMLDIDDFKKVNDTYGHDNGDEVLRRFGEVLSTYNDGNTVCGRYGGEEFVIVFKYGETRLNCDVVEEFRGKIADIVFPFMERGVTLSAGYYIAEEQTDFESALKKADDALYYSKRTGKNKLTIHSQMEGDGL